MTCIIVEDGTIVADANSYITAAEAETLLNSVGETFGDQTETDIEKYLLKATRYLESFRAKYRGTKTDSTQALQWPRSNAYIDGNPVDADTIPQELKMAQALAAMTELSGSTLQEANDGKTILQETIGGQISVTYANNGMTGNTMYFPVIDTYLKPLLKSSSRLEVYRT